MKLNIEWVENENNSQIDGYIGEVLVLKMLQLSNCKWDLRSTDLTVRYLHNSKIEECKQRANEILINT